MKSQHYSGQLFNHLDPSSHSSDEDFEFTRSDYEKGSKDGGKQGKFARGAGLIILLLAILFVIQRFVFPVGPDLTSILRLIPVTGVILVLVIGLGLLSRSRSRRRKEADSEWRLKNEEAALGGMDSYASPSTESPNDPASETSSTAGSHARSDTQPPPGSRNQSYAGSDPQTQARPDTGSADTEDRAYEGASTSSHKTSGSHYSGDSHDEPYGYEMHRKWYRSREEKMLFGVCGGIAERLDVDPTIVRALFALAFLSYGFSLVIYVVLAVVLPKKPQHSLL